MAISDADAAKISAKVIADLVPLLGYLDGSGNYHSGLITDALADKFSGCTTPGGSKVPNKLIFEMRSFFGCAC